MGKRTWPRAAGYHWDQKDKLVLPCGRKSCRWCKGPITAKGRRTFCSDPCVQEWRRRAYPEDFRQAAFKADGGICQICSIDCRFLDTYWIECQLWIAKGAKGVAPHNDADGKLYPVKWWLAKLVEAHQWKVEHNAPRHAFEIDHIVPVVEGGDFFDPTNLRVLCVPCHKIITGQFATKRARERRQPIAPPPTEGLLP